MARLLTLQLPYHFDYGVGRYISLERIFEESKESYYDTLEASSHGWHEAAHDIAPTGKGRGAKWIGLSPRSTPQESSQDR